MNLWHASLAGIRKNTASINKANGFRNKASIQASIRKV